MNLSLKDLLKVSMPQHDVKENFLLAFAVNVASAAVAAAVTMPMTYPLDFARTVLQANTGQKKHFSGVLDCLKTTASKQGPLALYRGFGACAACVVVFRGVQFGCFDTLMSLNPYDSMGFKGIVTCFLAAQLAGILALPFAYPFDTICVRMLTDHKR